MDDVLLIYSKQIATFSTQLQTNSSCFVKIFLVWITQITQKE